MDEISLENNVANRREKMLEFHRADYLRERSKPFEHFYCPILGVDEPTELCIGHVVNKALLDSCRATVIQRSDVDSFYGSVAEAELVTVVENRSKRLDEMFIEKQLYRVFRPRLEKDGEVLEHYVPAGPVPKTHSRVQFQGSDGTCFDLCVKITPNELLGVGPNRFQMVLEADFRANAIASVIKAAHLSLFHMLGYHYVFSPSGQWTAGLLADFFLTGRNLQEAELRKWLRSYFAKYESMVVPLGGDPDQLRGTVEDKEILLLAGASNRVFAIGVIVRLRNERFCAFLPPDDGKDLETYLSFLQEPPPSVAARHFKFVPAKSGVGAHWETPPGKPFRIYRRPDSFPSYWKALS